MLPLLSGARRRLRVAGQLVAATAVLVLALAIAPPRAGADYQTVVGGLQQWLWVRSQTAAPMTAAVVRPDGWLIVATNERFDGRDNVGGGLLLVPPWGGTPIPFGDPPNPATNEYGFTSLVMRENRLFGLTSLPYQHSGVGQKARLVELDARSGKVIATHGNWWFPDLAVDPRTGDLVLWTFRCTGQCTDDDTHGEDVGAIRHELVRYNPESHRTTQVLLPDAMDADIGGSDTCGARRGTLHNCEQVYRIAFSSDGNTLFLGTARAETNAVDVRDRSGALRFTISVPRPIDAMRFGAPSSCFANTLVLTSYDGTAWAIPNAAGNAAATGAARSIATGAPTGVSAAAMTPDGNMLTLRRSEGELLACTGWGPPKPPVPAGPPSLRTGDPPKVAAVPSAGQPHAAAPTAPSASSANPPPPVQPPSSPAVAGPVSHAAQSVTGLNIGLADVKEEEPVYSLSASRRAPDELAWASLGVGGAAALGFAAVAFMAIPPRRIALARPREDRR